MARKLFLHIGPGKTGSSALQVFFARNVDALQSQGINYQVFENVRRAMAGQTTSGNGVKLYCYAYPDKHQRDFDLEELCNVIDEYFGSCSRALVSSELLSVMPFTCWERVKEACDRLSVTIVIVAFVRHCYSHMQSVYRHNMARGTTMSFLEFLQTQEAYYPSATLRPILRVFGRESLVVYNYDVDRDRLPDRILDVLEVPPKTLSMSAAREQVNVSPRIETELTAEVADVLSKRYAGCVKWINETIFDGRNVVHLLGEVAEPPRRWWGRI